MPEDNKLEQQDSVEQDIAELDLKEGEGSFEQQMAKSVEDFLTTVEKKKLERLLRDALKYAKLAKDEESGKFFNTKYQNLLRLILNLETWLARR